MKEKKKGFTLVELMAVIAVFSILGMMIGPMMIQTQRIFNKTDNRSSIQDEFRTAIMNIEKEMQSNYDNEIIVFENKDSVKLIDGNYSEQKAVLAIVPPSNISNEKTLYFQVKDNKSNKTKVIEVKSSDINDLNDDGTIKQLSVNNSSIRVLVDNIEGESSGEFIVQKENGLINVSIAGIGKGNSVREEAYVGSISMNNDIMSDSIDDTVVPDEEYPFLNGIKNNINIFGNIDYKGSSNFNEIDDSISIGISGVINGNVGGQNNVEKNPDLNKIRFKNKVLDKITVKNQGISINPNNMQAYYIGEGSDRYAVYLIKGSNGIGIEIDFERQTNIKIENSIIISAGKMYAHSDNASETRTLEVNNSIIYANGMDVDKNKLHMISTNPVDSESILKSYVKVKDEQGNYIDSTVGEELAKVLESAGLEIIN